MPTIRIPLWGRVTLIIGLVIAFAGAGLFGYRYFTRPVTLTVAVGSFDGEASRAMAAIASRLVSINASIRLKVADTGTALEAAKQFAAGKTDLAVVRGDVGDVSQARSVVVVAHVVSLLIVPPDSSITSIDKLKGHTVGVVGGEANAKLVDVLTKEYDLTRAEVTFKSLPIADVRRALQAKEISALLVVIPLSEKYLTMVRSFFPQNPKKLPTIISIDSAGAIADAERAYESFDVPKGTLRGAPPVPDDDVTVLRAALYLVASKKLSSDLVATLTQTLMAVRRDLLNEQPMFAQMTSPSTDTDAYLPLHPGAAAFYNGTTQSFMDEYSNWIYLTPMVLGFLASVGAAAWKFLGVEQVEAKSSLDALYTLAHQARRAETHDQLSSIEEELENVLKLERAKAAQGDATAVDATTLNVAAHRLESLVRDRRTGLAKSPV